MMTRDKSQGIKTTSHEQLMSIADVVSGVAKGRKLTGITSEVPYLRVANVQDGFLDLDEIKLIPAVQAEVERYRLFPGDVVLTEGGDADKLGRGALWQGEIADCIHQNHVFRVRLDQTIILPEFFVYFLQSPPAKDYFLKCAKKTTNLASINMNQLKALPVPIPSKAEQEHIVATFDRLHLIRNKRLETIEKLSNLMQSYFHHMFGDVVKNDREWPYRAFGEVCESRLGKMLDAKQQTGLHKRRYLRNANVLWNRFDLSDLLEMDFNAKDQETFRLDYGDVLICEGGEVGRSAIWRQQLSECYYQKALHRVRPNVSILTPEYLVFLMYFLAKHGGLSDHVTSATIAHLTGEKLKRMDLPLPPLTLQQSFSVGVSSIEAKLNLCRESLAHIEKLMASVNRDVFVNRNTEHEGKTSV